METKKNPHADLESKRTLFFLIGMAIALLTVILVLQYRTPITQATLPKPDTETISFDTEIPRTVRKVAELEKPEKIVKKFNPNLPPEVVPDKTKLKLEFKNLLNPDNGDEKPVDIGMEPEKPEPVPWISIDKIARPFECEDEQDHEAQKECFSKWMQNFVNRNAKYPTGAKELKLQDKVYVSMIFDEFGKLESAEVAKGQYPVLNDEALRVVNSLPQLLPASQNGKKARMRMTIPVNFRLN